ncbi:hypothetical protein HMPREF2748_00150 [Corynebacterium sp. HMSC077B05]|nr:hypothetical protein HMPREF2748_00150 [Corynebacterium sp. HMSC077B05]
MLVLVSDSVVVERWSTCFLVAGVLLGCGDYFGECITPPISSASDISRIFMSFGAKVKPPIQHESLVFS